VPETITAPDGSPVNAVRGTLDLVARIVRDTRPARLVACLDLDWRPSFRVAAVPSYKAHRLAENGAEAEPPSLGPQVAVLLEVLDAVGIAVAGAEGHEADDVLGTLSARETGPVDVGLRRPGHVPAGARRRPGAGALRGREAQAVRRARGGGEVRHPGTGYAEYAVLRGDPSDGLPGVKGVGDKTAAALVTRFGTVEGILAALDAGTDDGFPAGARAKLEAARDYLAVAPAVTRTVRDLPIPELDDALPRAPRNPERLVELSDQWGLDSPLDRLLAAFEIAHAG
jgi:5'-3' exonuclease